MLVFSQSLRDSEIGREIFVALGETNSFIVVVVGETLCHTLKDKPGSKVKEIQLLRFLKPCSIPLQQILLKKITAESCFWLKQIPDSLIEIEVMHNLAAKQTVREAYCVGQSLNYGTHWHKG